MQMGKIGLLKMGKLENQMEISQPGCSNDIIDTQNHQVGRPSWSHTLEDEINSRGSCQQQELAN